jgi:hypothetical protein
MEYSHWMVLFQNCVRQSRSHTKMATTVQLRCYWKQLWSRWAITGSCEPLVCIKVWFQTRRFVCEFPRGSYVKLSSAVGAILVEGPNRPTQFWKRTWPPQCSFIVIESSFDPGERLQAPGSLWFDKKQQSLTLFHVWIFYLFIFFHIHI